MFHYAALMFSVVYERAPFENKITFCEGDCRLVMGNSSLSRAMSLSSKRSLIPSCKCLVPPRSHNSRSSFLQRPPSLPQHGRRGMVLLPIHCKRQNNPDKLDLLTHDRCAPHNALHIVMAMLLPIQYIRTDWLKCEG